MKNPSSLAWRHLLGTILFAFSSHDQPIEHATESKTHRSHRSGFVQRAVTGMLAPPSLARSLGRGLSRRGETPVTAYALTRRYASLRHFFSSLVETLD